MFTSLLLVVGVAVLAYLVHVLLHADRF
ncbi:MAG: potassium-transporting ATPase subunit F [Terrabacter sp.]|nr:potassium-transporting ATPase subunit F [Terrabacter sp.]